MMAAPREDPGEGFTDGLDPLPRLPADLDGVIHDRLSWLAFIFKDASRYVLDGNGARLDELRKQYKPAAGRGLPVKHEIAAVRLKVAVYAHPLHQWFRLRTVELPAASGKFEQFAAREQSLNYFIPTACEFLVFTGFVIRT
jgi:hypothetical protein